MNKNNFKMKTKTIFLVIAILFNINLFSQEKAYEKAKKESTIEAYEKFIKKNPGSAHLVEIEYLLAKKKNNIESLSAYISKYPQSEYIPEIEYKIVELKNDTTLYKEYINKYPKTSYAKDAQYYINNLSFPYKFNQFIACYKKDSMAIDSLTIYANAICNYPPSIFIAKQYKDYEYYTNSIAAIFQNINKLPLSYVYINIELIYYLNNSIVKSTMKLMMERVLVKFLETSKKTTALTNTLFPVIAADTIVSSQLNGLNSVNRLLKNADLQLSNSYSKGENIMGFEIMINGIPINIKVVKEMIAEIKKNNKSKEVEEVLKSIEEQINI